MTLALKSVGDQVWDRVGVEPSGTAFNSLVQLEYNQGIPRNPLVNAGAIVICDILVGCLGDAKTELLDFIRSITGLSGINYCQGMAESEMRSGYRNYSLRGCLKSDEMCRLVRKGLAARRIPNGVSPKGYPFGMERGAVVISDQTLRAELLWARGRCWARGPGPTGPGTSSPPCPTTQINFCDTLQHL